MPSHAKADLLGTRCIYLCSSLGWCECVDGPDGSPRRFRLVAQSRQDGSAVGESSNSLRGRGTRYARVVAGLLPTAIAQVEAAQGRPFAHPVTIGVYVTPEAFAAANGTGFSGAVGVMFLGAVNLSPRLFSAQRQRLPAILTHELSHAHIRSWISELTYIRLPNWFKEGLAVAVSRGGGAESVSDSQAMAVIQRGDHIAIAASGSLTELSGVKFEHEQPYSPFRFELAYRQAGMFVSYLRDADPSGFARMINSILDGRQFEEAVAAGYRENLHSLWLRFMQTGTKSQ
jgi:hypothetical protein